MNPLEFHRFPAGARGVRSLDDLRRLKVPMGRLSTMVLRAPMKSAARERITHFSPDLRARLQR